MQKPEYRQRHDDQQLQNVGCRERSCESHRRRRQSGRASSHRGLLPGRPWESGVCPCKAKVSSGRNTTTGSRCRNDTPSHFPPKSRNCTIIGRVIVHFLLFFPGTGEMENAVVTQVPDSHFCLLRSLSEFQHKSRLLLARRPLSH